MLKKIIASGLLAAFALSPLPVLADAAVGDQIVTIGDNLNQEQQAQVMNHFGNPQNAQVIYVNIAEEQRYLGGVVPQAQIGNSTNSCAMITYTSKGSGIDVQTHNINYVTPSAYESALLTAGVTDADVSVTAPFEVSGTGALTGIMKAYEVSTGQTIEEDVKHAATKELVTNAKLAETVGEEESTDVINDIKKQVADERPQTDADIQIIIDKVLSDNNITLTDAQYQELLDMVRQFSQLDIDWNGLSQELQKFGNQASDYLQSEEGQNLLAQLQDLLNQFINWLRDVFGGSNADTPADPQGA